MYRSHYSADDRSGWTYLIEAESVSLVKIGAAKDFWPRFQSIQVCSPVPLRLAALVRGRGYENTLHRRFAEWRIRGEWFDLEAPGLRDLIQAHAWVDDRQKA